MKRLLASFLLSFTPAMAFADEPAPAPAAAPAPARPRLMGVILTGAQALLWDDATSQYLLKRVGDELSGGKIVALEVDRVVIESGGLREAIEMTAAPGSKSLRRAKRMPALIVGAQPEEPLGAAAASATAEIPPLAAFAAAPTPAPIAVAAVTAPALAPPAVSTPALAPPAASAPPVSAPAVTPPAASAPAVSAPALAPPAVSAPKPVTVDGGPPSPDSPVVVIPRAVLDKELQDFGALSEQVALARGPRGGFRLTRIQPGSFADHIGLYNGDIVLRVDGRPINGVEDASAAYAWLRITDKFTVDVVRGGRQVRLRYVITGPATAQR